MRKENMSAVVIFDIGLRKITGKQFSKFETGILLTKKVGEGVDVLRDALEKGGGKSIVIDIDALDPDAIEKAALMVEKDLGSIGIWVNNMGYSNKGFDIEPSIKEHEEQIEKYYFIKVYAILRAINRVIPREKRSILFLSPGLIYKKNSSNSATEALQFFFKMVKSEIHKEGSKVEVKVVSNPAVLDTPAPLNLSVSGSITKFEWVSLWEIAIQGIVYLSNKERLDDSCLS